MEKPYDQTKILGERILAAMQEDTGISKQMAQPFVQSVLRCFAGEQPYFPVRQRQYPVEKIREQLLMGEAVSSVTKRFGLSRAKLHQLFPGGLPRVAGKLSR
ncbi:hypothetical protein KWH07_06175 [Xanthomonas campestris pv. zingibericola]|uniref:hypothetical protein n=1 Tax=Xanthomonas euvesicatoria TaxID=456327 RepID=UPI001C437AC3|nr:hypothetical protein [Xanthomonas euvesicatoria]MBV6857231.1 hypothetical protein [Xanthomonas campestris pv. zingibericola]